MLTGMNATRWTSIAAQSDDRRTTEAVDCACELQIRDRSCVLVYCGARTPRKPPAPAAQSETREGAICPLSPMGHAPRTFAGVGFQSAVPIVWPIVSVGCTIIPMGQPPVPNAELPGAAKGVPSSLQSWLDGCQDLCGTRANSNKYYE